MAASEFRARLGLPSDFVDIPVVRLAGSTRAGTTAAISQELNPAGTETAIIVSGESGRLSDALVAGPLARSYNAPILLSGPDGLLRETQTELVRLRAKHVVIVGGEAAVGTRVVDELTTDGFIV